MIFGENIALRPIEERDLEFLRGLANDRVISSQVVGWDFAVSASDQQAWFAGLRGSPHQRMMVVDREDDVALGLTGLWDIDWHNRSALSATKLSPDRTGRGIGTDAIMTTMAWAFYDVGLRRLHSTILDFNVASMRAYSQHCGWRVEGRARESVFRAGRWCDEYHVAALRTDFDAHPRSNEYVERLFPVDLSGRVGSDGDSDDPGTP